MNRATMGLSLSAWLESTYDYADGTYVRSVTPEFERAMQEMGTNAIPHLLEMLEGTERPLVVRGLMGTPVGAFLVRHWMLSRERVMNGFTGLGVLVTNAIPGLLEQCVPPHRSGLVVFDKLGPFMMPHIEQEMWKGDSRMTQAGMYALSVGAYDYRREEVVQVWTECLTNAEPSTRLLAAQLIGSTTPVRAQNAIPALRTAVNDPNPEVAAMAGRALGRLTGGK